MANPHKGEVSFEVGEKTFTLRYSTNAICELEEALGRGIIAIGDEMQSWLHDKSRVRMTTVRAVFWAGLRDHHPDVDLKAAGDLVMEAGGITAATLLIGSAFERAFPETKGARPPKPDQPATAGTGLHS